MEREYPLLEIEAQNNGITKTDIAVNEVNIAARTGKMLALDVSLSDKQTINIKGDGILISTPAGSTAYNSSLGGPIIPHTIPAFVITPKAPWDPKGQRPILVEDSKIIKINSTGRIPNTEIYCDGEELLSTDNDQETNIIVKKSQNPITVLIAEDYLEERDGKVFGELGFQCG
ncbi:MAG: hypothetical protein LBD11_07595 [Candidatus Peribacteria bacterium]|nr:hypothetical protein [Candidatus Peribacteria bacterium]